MTLKTILCSPLLQISVVNRYSGIYLTRPDSVSDHTTQVGLIALMMANGLKKSGVSVDLGQLALKALVHDIDECITCDVPRNVKYYNDVIKSHLDEVSSSSVKKISKQLEFEELYKLWENSKDDTLEGFIVKLADMLHVVKKLSEELELLNNMHMLKVLLEISDYLNGLYDYIISSEFKYENSVQDYFSELVLDAVKEIHSLESKYENIISKYVVTNHIL